MADTYEIPIKRRHYAGTTLLEAGGLGLQHWAYDETNEQFGVRLANGTYRYHCRSKVYPPGAGTTAALQIDATNNVEIPTDGAAIEFGVDKEIAIKHVADRGLYINTHLALGGTLRNWHDTNISALQFNGLGSLSSSYQPIAGGAVYLTNNLVYDLTQNSWVYVIDDEASKYQQMNGRHLFYTSALGSANAVATDTLGFEISAAGDMGLGLTPTLFETVQSKISIAFPTDNLEVIDYDEDDTTPYDTRAGAIRVRLNGVSTSVYLRTWRPTW
jgi:hypothetical protein